MEPQPPALQITYWVLPSTQPSGDHDSGIELVEDRDSKAPFDPARKLFKRFNYFRRLHRKLVVIDGSLAFIGGINYSADHLGDFGPKAKQDYAVEVEGPIVAGIHAFMHEALAQGRPRRHWFRRRPPAPPGYLKDP